MIPNGFQFSQTSLQDYRDCTRRFELRYLEKLRWPAIVAEPSDAYERHIRLGEAFHRLVHQSMLDIPLERLDASITDDELRTWWTAFQTDALAGLPEERYNEITLFTTIGGYRLLAKYDLLAILPGEKAVIVDWKTGQYRPRRETLEQRLQTLVYRYVLAEAGAQLNGGQPISPEQVEMVYWFAQNPQKTERFQYDAKAHQAARQMLEALIREIDARTVFELTPDVSKCRHCVYRSLCERGIQAGDMSNLDLDAATEQPTVDFDFDQIAEAEF